MNTAQFHDIAGKLIHMGDRIATTHRGYADLTRATVVGFTPKKIKVVIDSEYTMYEKELDSYFVHSKFPYQIAVTSSFHTPPLNSN